MLYGKIIDTIVPVTSCKVAETVKLLENTFRSVNIGLVNEIALMCDRLNINVWEVIDAAATKPFGFMPFYPGPGLGGHCIPIDPFYLSWKAKSVGFEARFIELAGQVNSQMPFHVVSKIQDALNDELKSVKSSKILILGVAYKADIEDVRESPALDIMKLLIKKGAIVNYHDPYVPLLKLCNKTFESVNSFEGFDCAVLVTDHRCFNANELLSVIPIIVDSRNFFAEYKEDKRYVNVRSL